MNAADMARAFKHFFVATGDGWRTLASAIIAAALASTCQRASRSLLSIQ
jgi:hypothetical protein